MSSFQEKESIDDNGNKTIKKVTRDDYSKTIVNINMNIEGGFYITYETSVADFITTINALKEKSERLKHQLQLNKKR